MKTIKIAPALIPGLLSLAVCACGQSFLSTLNDTVNNAWGLGNNGTELAQQFTTGSQSEAIGSVSVDILGVSGAAFTISLYDDVSGQPGTMLSNGLLSGPSSPTSSSINLYDATGLTLAANTTYWVVFNNNDGGQVDVANAASSSFTTSAGWTLGSTGFYYGSSPGPYNLGYTGSATPLFSIDSVAAPEPTTSAFLALGGLILAVQLRRK